MAVVAVMVGISVPLTHSIVSEERLRQLGNDLADVAVTARKLSVRDGRTYVIRSENGRVGLGPWAGEGMETDEVLALKLPANARVSFRHSEEEKWANDIEWLFHPGGISDPMQIRLQEGRSWSVREFSPLTAQSQEESSHYQ